MVFLNPTSDIAFKKLFGNQAKTEILMSFLNSVLDRKEGEKITKVTITDPNNNPDTKDLKYSIVDLRCTDQAEKQYIIEVQVKYQEDYPERVQHYVALAIARQLKKAEKYKEIMPVIFIGVLSKPILESPHYTSHHNLRDVRTQEHALRHMDFHFIELSKFNKTLDELETVTDKWIYLLKNAEGLDSIPEQLQSPIELEEAMDELQHGRLTVEQLEAYDRYLDARRVEQSVEDSLIKRTQEEASREKAHEIAKQLLDVLDIKTIAQKTGLSIEDVEKLKKG